VAGVGVWPAERYPSGPAFIVPGVVVTVAVWAVAAGLQTRPVVSGLERAGQRTLLVYVAHYALRVVLDLGGWWAALDGPGWTAAAVGLAALIAIASAAPWRSSPTQPTALDQPAGATSGSGSSAANADSRNENLAMSGPHTR
jgi:hypothetical protein